MKKFSYLFCGLLFFAIVSCEKEDFSNEKTSSMNIKNSLLGKWSIEVEPSNILKLKRGYNFKQDNSFEYLEKVINSSGDILGFRHRLIGKYEVKDNKLTLFYSQHFMYDHNKGEYENIENLTLTGEAGSPKTVTMDFNMDKNILTLYFPPCGPLEYCLGSNFTTLYKD
ncbi:hypothetical protein OB13_05505 [Pontibacter sp. HJ8]